MDKTAALSFMLSRRLTALTGLTCCSLQTLVTTMSPASSGVPFGSISVAEDVPGAAPQPPSTRNRRHNHDISHRVLHARKWISFDPETFAFLPARAGQFSLTWMLLGSIGAGIP
jgi:hypothetical protein